MDRIFYNGLIRTVEDSCPTAEAVAVENGRIAFIGSSEAALALCTAQTELIDLRGNTLYPGFIDSHMHLLDTAYLRTKLDLSACRYFSEVLDILKTAADHSRHAGTASRIDAVNFNQDRWKDHPFLPTRLELDAAVPDLPCCITRVCGHVRVCNTAALRRLDLLDYEKAVLRFKTGRLPDGTSDGRIYESDIQLEEGSAGEPDISVYRAFIESECRHCAEQGLTGIHSDDFGVISDSDDSEAVLCAFHRIAEDGGTAIRVFEQCRLPSAEAIRNFAAKYPCGTSYGRFKTVSIKELLDGSLGARSAYLRDGYPNHPEAANIASFTQAEITELAIAANQSGYPMAAHCIGDGAVDLLLNAFDAAQQTIGRNDLRNGVIHCQIMRYDQLERMADMNVLAYVQPVFLKADAAIVEPIVGTEIAKQSYNWRKMWDLGIHVSNGTDCPVERNDPIQNFYYAVTRDGGNGSPWFPENAMTAEEALKAYTIEAAYAAGEEKELGSVTVGKKADFTVLNADFLTIDPDRIPNTSVVMTVVDGMPVYQNPRFLLE